MTASSVRRKLSAGLVALLAGVSAWAATVPDTIEQRVAACIACHGREGSSTNAGYFPRLAGKPAGYLFNQLQSFRDGRRFQSDMVYMTRHLSDPYLREIAEYFSSLDLPYARVNTSTDASAQMLAHGQALALKGDAARGIPACVACHGSALMGVQPGVPPLLGLPRLYIASQLGAWLTNDRHALPPDCMTDVGRKLNSADINAVASWLATQPVPANIHPAKSPPAPLPMKCSAMPQ
ncbi:MAG: c-type cytochrome [Proteobacteria bacterium]|nr:c-type cytochrome [Pseudomonadota bacterium]